MRFEIVREKRLAADLFTQQRWVFWVTCDRSYAGVMVFIEEYYEEERPSRRHKFRPVRGYRRIDQRYMGQFEGIDVDDVPLPDDVEAEAMERVMDSVLVSRWKRR